MKKSSFQWDIDDSSDEESVTKALGDYDFEDKHQFYLEEPSFPAIDADGYSPALHMMGVELLYSPAVNALYYPQKHTLLNGSTLPTNEQTRNWVRLTVDRTIRSLLSLSHHEADCHALANRFIEQHPDIIEETTIALLKNKRRLMKQGNINQALTGLREACETFLQEEEDDIALAEAAQSFTISALVGHTEIVDTLVPNLNAEIAWLQQKGYISADGKQLPAAERRKKRAGNNFTPLQHYLFTQATKEGYRQHVSGLINKAIVASHIVTVSLADEPNAIVTDRTRRDNLTYSFTAIPQDSQLLALYNNHPELIKPYISASLSTLKEEMLEELPEDIQSVFYEHLKKDLPTIKRAFDRKTLPQQYALESTTALQHLANLRLSNRSQKRAIQQMQCEQGPAIDGETYNRSWQFGGLEYVALETHEITKHGSRTDLVENLANYKEIADTLTTLRENINKKLAAAHQSKIGDRALAKAIKSIVQGEGFSQLLRIDGTVAPLEPGDFKVLRKHLVNLTYLLFGTEAVRNPSALVLHPLLLDLVIDGTMSWKKALSHAEYETQYGGGMMPMSMGSYKKEGSDKKQTAEPVPCARALQDAYADVLPWAYRYPGEAQKNEEKTSELIRREEALAKTWVEKYAPQKQNFTDKMDAIRQSARTFYGID